MSPNDLIFFPVKLQLNPDLMVEISAGNTSEISTRKALKSRNLAKNRLNIAIFRLKICCRQKFLTVPKFYFSKSMTSELHFALRIKVVAQKVANLIQTEICGF